MKSDKEKCQGCPGNFNGACVVKQCIRNESDKVPA